MSVATLAVGWYPVAFRMRMPPTGPQLLVLLLGKLRKEEECHWPRTLRFQTLLAPVCSLCLSLACSERRELSAAPVTLTAAIPPHHDSCRLLALWKQKPKEAVPSISCLGLSVYHSNRNVTCTPPQTPCPYRARAFLCKQRLQERYLRGG